MRYTKLPVTIEAVCWNGDRFDHMTDWLSAALHKDEMEQGSIKKSGEGLFINTTEGKMAAYAGDYIIRGVEGEVYPCKSSVFHATYVKEGEVLPSIRINNGAIIGTNVKVPLENGDYYLRRV